MAFLLNRRSLLRSAIGAAVASAKAQPRGLHWALLSDLHISADPRDAYRGFVPTENLKLVAVQVAKAKPETVIINGDLARLVGEKADYSAILSLLQPIERPIGMTLGNHDHRENFLATVTKHEGQPQPIKDRTVAVIETDSIRFLLLDSLLQTNLAGGLLGKEQRQWLARYLDGHDQKPTIIFVHHTLGSDDIDLFDANRLMETVLPRKQVKAIFYGHSHTWRTAKEADLHLINLPAVGYNFTDGEPIGWVEAQFTPRGSSLRFHVIGGGAQPANPVTNLEWR